MSKKCVITQIHNEEKQQYEYFVKGYDITESIKILLKKHKEAYDKERRIFAEAKGYIEAQKEYETQLHNQQNEIQQLKQENETLFLQLSKQEIDEHKPVYCTLAGNDCKYLGKIKQLKQQLAEKGKRIAELENENGYILFEDGYDENGKEIHRQVYTTYHQAFNELVFEAKKLRRQLKEKDKEIEKLKQQYTILENENGKLTTELIMGKYKKAQKEVSFGMQLAIQELEKVKNFVDGRTYCANYIKKRIKELKGEKDVKD